MIADLSIAWIFWFVIRWPMLRTSIHLQDDIQKVLADIGARIRDLQLESEIASQRELRAAGLAD